MVRLTILTDLALRTLMYLGNEGERLCTVREIASAYNVSDNHLMKAVQRLKNAGFIESVRGNKGGIRLSRKPEDIRIGDVVRELEDNFRLAECFEATNNKCVVTPVCGLNGMLGQALDAFFGVLDSFCLADVLKASPGLGDIFRRMAAEAAGEEEEAKR